MATPSPYRSLAPEQRVALLRHAMHASRETRAHYVGRLASLRGGFRVVTLQTWPVDRLAREVVRRNAEQAEDERDLLHHLYVELDPAVQITFLDAAGVAHEKGQIADDAEPPYTDAESVRRAAAAVRERHGASGEHYLRTIARYNPAGWPGIDDVVAELETG